MRRKLIGTVLGVFALSALPLVGSPRPAHAGMPFGGNVCSIDIFEGSGVTPPAGVIIATADDNIEHIVAATAGTASGVVRTVGIGATASVPGEPSAMSGDGRYRFTFVGDTIRRVDLTTAATIDVAAGFGLHRHGAASSNGRFFAFVTSVNLAADTDGLNDVYLRDTDAGTTTLLSRTAANLSLETTPDDVIGVSDDGTTVAFTGGREIWIRRLSSAGATRLHQSLTNISGFLTADGSSLLVADDVPRIYDVATGTSAPLPFPRFATVSHNGRWIAVGQTVYDRFTPPATAPAPVPFSDIIAVSDDGLRVLRSGVFEPGTSGVIVARSNRTLVSSLEPSLLPVGAVTRETLNGHFPGSTAIDFGPKTVFSPTSSTATKVVGDVAVALDAIPTLESLTTVSAEGCVTTQPVSEEISKWYVDPQPSVIHPGESRSIGLFSPPGRTIDGAWFGAGITSAPTGTRTGLVPVDANAPTTARLGFTSVGVAMSRPNGASAEPDWTFSDALLVRPWRGEFHPLQPARIVDTRDGVGGSRGKIGPGQTVTTKVTGTGGVPASGVGAVVVNVTAAEPTRPSYVTIFPGGSARPLASSLNLIRGEDVPNLVTVGVGPSGEVSIYNNAGDTHIVFDVVGWYSNNETRVDGDAYVPFVPVRILDTRDAGDAGKLDDRHYIRLPVFKAGSRATTAALNITVIEPTAASHLAVVPSVIGTPSNEPGTSNLNFAARQTVANMVIVPVGADGAVDIFNHAGATHVVVDVLGVFDDGSLPIIDGQLEPVMPARVLDTRDGTGASGNGFGGPVPPDRPVHLVIAGNHGVPLDASALVLNVTVTDAAGPGHAAVWPSGVERPVASNLNYVVGQTVPNMVIVPIGDGGAIELGTGTSAAHLIADVVGWIGAPGATGTAPAAKAARISAESAPTPRAGSMADSAITLSDLGPTMRVISIA